MRNLLTKEGLEDLHAKSSFQGAAMKMLDPLMHEAVSTERAAGHPYLLSQEDRAKMMLSHMDIDTARLDR